MSFELKSESSGFPGGIVVRSYTRSENNEHSSVRYNEFDSILKLCTKMRDVISARNSLFTTEELDEEFITDFKFRDIIKEKRFRCDCDANCKGTVETVNIIDPSYTSPFLFVVDPANYTERNNEDVNDTYFPDEIILLEDIKYVLRGRIYVTSRNGHHLYKVIVKINILHNCFDVE